MRSICGGRWPFIYPPRRNQLCMLAEPTFPWDIHPQCGFSLSFMDCKSKGGQFINGKSRHKSLLIYKKMAEHSMRLNPLNSTPDAEVMKLNALIDWMCYIHIHRFFLCIQSEWSPASPKMLLHSWVQSCGEWNLCLMGRYTRVYVCLKTIVRCQYDH